MKGKYLITADSWFITPDGKQYKAAWGEVEIITDEFLGVTTNRNSSNWFAKIGNDEKHIVIAGCEIHYAVKCEEEPITDSVMDYSTSDSKCSEFLRPTQIYIAE